MTFSTKYLAEAVALLGIAWAVIRWVGRSVLDISGGSRDAEGHRLLASLESKRPAPAPEPSVAAPSLEVTFRELRADGPMAVRAASMSEPERQAVYDDLVRQLESDGVSDAERAFALTVAMKRLGLKNQRR